MASPKTSGRRANVMEPEEIIERFYRQLQPPSVDEGFEEVVIVRGKCYMSKASRTILTAPARNINPTPVPTAINIRAATRSRRYR